MTKKPLKQLDARRKLPGKPTLGKAGTISIDRLKVGKRYRHELGDITPLSDSMHRRGLFHPVVITRDKRLIAGARRIAAAKQLGWTKIPVTIIDLDDIVHGEFDENALRKNFTLSESVAIADALEARERVAAKARQAAAGPSSGRGKKATASAKLPEPVKGRALDKIAKALGMSRTTLQRARTITDMAKADPAFAKLKADMDKSGRVNAPFRRLHVTQQAKALRHEMPPLPMRGPYHVAVVDPPWAYEPHDDGAERGVLPYATLSIKEICDLDINSIMHQDAIIFLWVTNFILARGLHLKVLTSWGAFEPKTLITWPKDRAGKGFWVKGQTEHLVMAVRGKPVVDLTDQTTLLGGPFHLVRKNKHSAKPIEAYNFIERLCPAPRYADIFSRYQHNTRWDTHGDEVGKAPKSTVEAAE